MADATSHLQHTCLCINHPCPVTPTSAGGGHYEVSVVADFILGILGLNHLNPNQGCRYRTSLLLRQLSGDRVFLPLLLIYQGSQIYLRHISWPPV